MGRVLTLLYHRVNHLKKDIHLLAVEPENFYEQIKYLKQNYRIVKFDEDWNAFDEDAICITFDDGYFDNYQYAVPILEELSVSATIFVATGTLNTQEEFWWDELERNLLLDDWDYDQRFQLEDDIFSCCWETDTYEARRVLYNTLHWLMYSKISVKKRKEWINQLRRWSRLGNEGRSHNLSIQLDKCIDFPSELITIGAHTVNHPSLSRLSYEEQEYEILTSKKELERIFKREIKTFSYPFGTRGDYDVSSIEICRRNGICKAASNYPGVYTEKCDLYQIPRNIIRNWELDTYKKEIDTFWNKGLRV